MSDEAKKAILLRRARFIAAAMAGLGTSAAIACGANQPEPEVCLSPPYVPPPEEMVDPVDAGDAGEPEPQPCLSPMMPPDRGGDGNDPGSREG